MPWLCEVGELANLVDVHRGTLLAHLAPACPEPVDQLLAAGDGQGWLAVIEYRLPLLPEGNAPNLATSGFLPGRSTLTWKHLRVPAADCERPVTPK